MSYIEKVFSPSGTTVCPSSPSPSLPALSSMNVIKFTLFRPGLNVNITSMQVAHETNLCPLTTGVACISNSKNSKVTKVMGSAFPNVTSPSFVIRTLEEISKGVQ